MRLIRVYCSQPLSTGSEVILTPQTSHHLLQVLRLKSGAKLNVFDGRGNEFSAELMLEPKGQARVLIAEKQASLSESPLHIHLIQGISRGEKMDYTLQKAVELGVSEITPLFTAFCEVKLNPERLEKRLEHWRMIMMNACEQCGRSYLPRLNAPAYFKAWIGGKGDSGDLLRLILTPTASQRLLNFDVNPTRVTLVIGPEGGFSEEELIIAQQQGFIGWRLGPRILRTETAGLAAISALQMHWGDFSPLPQKSIVREGI